MTIKVLKWGRMHHFKWMAKSADEKIKKKLKLNIWDNFLQMHLHEWKFQWRRYSHREKADMLIPVTIDSSYVPSSDYVREYCIVHRFICFITAIFPFLATELNKIISTFTFYFLIFFFVCVIWSVWKDAHLCACCYQWNQ